MPIIPFLAMTGAEMGKVSVYPPKSAWMACHFSPYGLGLSNLPRQLPPGSLILVDDITPIRGHDPEIISAQLQSCAEALDSYGIALDFQRPDQPETAFLVRHLVNTLHCPVLVSQLYAADLPCPVFLPPVPLSTPLREYLAPWQGRQLWLETGLEAEALTLTGQGCRRSSLPVFPPEAEGFADSSLHCHYTIETKKTSASFTLWRTKEDFHALLEEAETLGISGAIGLYQQLQYVL